MSQLALPQPFGDKSKVGDNSRKIGKFGNMPEISKISHGVSPYARRRSIALLATVVLFTVVIWGTHATVKSVQRSLAMPPIVAVPEKPLILLNGAPLFPLSEGALSEIAANTPVMAQRASVVNVPGIPGVGGFWMGGENASVGTGASVSSKDRIFVAIPPELAGANGSLTPAQLHAGDKVNVSGRLVAIPYEEQPFGLKGDDASALRKQEKCVVATSVFAA